MSYEKILRHYLRKEVQEEIVEWCRGRWIAFHCETFDEKGRRIFIRYHPKTKKPLKLDSLEEFERVFRDLSYIKPRAIYATINQYRVIEKEDDVFSLDNVFSTLPTWDIDSKLSDWKATIEIARVIRDILLKYGVEKSVYFKWSGNGMHVHLHQFAISREITAKKHPLDIAFAIVEFIRLKIERELYEIKRKYEVKQLKVENKIDVRRVFTAPLSIHRELDVVAVCMKSDDLENFDTSWIELDGFRHNTTWREFKEGEADELALKAYETIGGCPYIGGRYRRKRKTKKVEDMISKIIKKFGWGS